MQESKQEVRKYVSFVKMVENLTSGFSPVLTKGEKNEH